MKLDAVPFDVRIANVALPINVEHPTMSPIANEAHRYETVDLPFYRQEIAPILPAEVLDFHTHTWRQDHWGAVPWQSDVTGGKYMVTLPDYDVEQLLADGRTMFPDRIYRAVCFGAPVPHVALAQANAYLAQCGRRRGLYPLLLMGRERLPPAEIERAVRDEGFFGYKVILNWYGDDYGHITVEDMIGPAEMAVAHALKLVVLLHVPRSGRLADPVVKEGVRRLAREYPEARLVLAHCGRCYLPDEMRGAIGALADLPNVSLDTSMVMDPTVLQIVFETIGPARVVFATDYPVAAMRGRRVYVMDHWVDLVLEGYPPSAYRVASNAIRATFMAWEIVLAIRRAAEQAGVKEPDLRAVFFENGMALLRRVLDGRALPGR